jgi:hypothetical protein
MNKLRRISITLTVIFILTGMFFVSQANAAPNYYSNNFESSAALQDGYWSLHDAGIQTVGGSNVLGVDGEATFMPQHGGYALDNFTVQFDVFRNIVYENNSAFQGPFYEASDLEGNTVIRMGVYQRQMHDSTQQVGGFGFCKDSTGESGHYYFLFNPATDWSVWRLTVTTASTEGGYVANVTVQINGETVTDFATGMPRPDGMGEIFVSNITNEPVINPVAYQNLLPFPQAGVLVPTYTPSPVSYGSSGIHYDLMSNMHVQPVSANGASVSYIDNFYYGYAGTVPLSTVQTSTPTAAPTTNPTTSATPTPSPTVPEISTLAIPMLIIVLATAIVIKHQKNRQVE